MSVMQQPSATGEYIIYRQRRGVELVLTLIACAFGVVGWIVSYLNLRGAPRGPDTRHPHLVRHGAGRALRHQVAYSPTRTR